MTNQLYSNLYASEGTISMEDVLSHIPTKSDASMNAKLNESYSKEELWIALFQMFPTKAPGPDPVHFFQRH
jgi:hypothetical protein